MARAKNGNQRGVPTGPVGPKRPLGRPRPRTGGGMKLPTRKVRPPRPSDTGGGLRLRPRRRPNPRRARAVAQQRNVSRRRR